MIWRIGKTVFNLEIRIDLDPVTISNTKELSQWGDSLTLAKRVLEGEKHVTDKGYLLIGYAEPGQMLPYCKATLHLNPNLEALTYLELVMTNKEPYQVTSPLVQLQLADQVQLVKAEGSRLYLPLVREKLRLKSILK